MERKELKQRLVDIIVESRVTYGENGVRINGAEEIAEHLMDHGVVFATDTNDGCKWIPVTERLPGVECLACAARNGEMMIGRVVGSTIGWCCESVSETLFGVTHWMPMPEPPKGE